MGVQGAQESAGICGRLGQAEVAGVACVVVEAKAELERIREQVQNIE